MNKTSDDRKLSEVVHAARRRIIKDKRIILAGPQTIFRAGVARVLSLEHDMQIVAQCEEHTEIRVAVENA